MFGLKTRLIQIPPGGEAQPRESRPRPSFWVSARMMLPLFRWPIEERATALVEEASGSIKMSLPSQFVTRFFFIRPASRRSGISIKK